MNVVAQEVLSESPAQREPKIIRRQSSTPVQNVQRHSSITEMVLQDLFQGQSLHNRERMRRHVMRPETMSRHTVWSLYQLGLRLKRDGLRYNELRIKEVRRLLSLAPRQVKAMVEMDEHF